MIEVAGVRLTDEQVDAIEALVSFSEAMSHGKLTTLSLADAMKVAFAEGHDMLMIQLGMAMQATQLAQK